jgi:hypothetical protein
MLVNLANKELTEQEGSRPINRKETRDEDLGIGLREFQECGLRL